MPPTTDHRRKLVLELLEEQEVASQAQLLDLLEQRGVATTQPVLSRDLRALHVAKQNGVYRPAERVTPLEGMASLLRGARPAGPHLLVVFSEPGAASAIARALEAEQVDGVVGTVAGDDTVFVAVDDGGAALALRERLESLIE
jgi:transcriptional regulator of arginine metabolism